MKVHLKRERESINFVVSSNKHIKNGLIEEFGTAQECLVEANQNNYMVKVDSC